MEGRGGLVWGVSSLSLSLLPCALVFGRSALPYLSIWTAGCGVRLWCRDRKVSQDCLLFGLVNIFWLRGSLLETAGKRWSEVERSKDERAWMMSLVLGATALAWFVHQRSKSDHDSSSAAKRPEGAREWKLEHPKPLIFPCRTTHARIFPKKHAFGYSYLLCGFPVTPVATTADGLDITDGRDRIKGSWWLRIRAEDYLERGYGALGFYGKLKAFLREHGTEDADWSYAYLITAPRFFGYSFNPVSFWYIYSQDHTLQKMILEVNNTFGERRMYLLDGSSPPGPPESPPSEMLVAETFKTKFTDIWMKDFHVSPFNSRKGSYSLKALNPFPTPTFSIPGVDNTITLKSSKDYAKLVARVHTTGDPLDPATLGIIATLRFVGSWWWIGLVTFPRILKEAYKLYFRRSLQVWFRPEVLPSSIGRMPTSTECALQEIFKEYLDHLVDECSETVSITYHTAIPDRPNQIVAGTREGVPETNPKSLHIQISTPAFYSRFVHYAHTSEAFDRECLFTIEQNRTLWISQPEHLSLILPNASTARMEYERAVERGFFDELRWKLMKKLRCAPAEPAYPTTPRSPKFDIDDIRNLPYSELDSFVRGPAGRAYAGSYRRMVTKLFLAQRFAFGFAEALDLLDGIIRAAFCYHGSAKLIAWVGAVGQSVDPSKSIHPGVLNEAVTSCWSMIGTALALSGCHIYGLVKGYR